MPAAAHNTFDRMMPYEVYVYPRAGYDKYGEPQYVSTPRGPYKAVITDYIATERDMQGVELKTTTTAYVNTDGTRIESDDKILLPLQFGGDTRKIGRVINWPDPRDGVVYGVEVHFL